MFPGASERVQVHEIIRGLINVMVGGMMQATIAATEGLADFEAVRTAPTRVARFTDEAAQCSRELKAFLRAQVYESEPVRSATRVSVGRMEELFDMLLAHPEHMPETYRQESANEPLHRQVCDYIAGMTDGFFLKTCDQMGVK